MPTRNARNGMLFTKEGIINIKNEKWKDDFSPIESDSSLFADTAYSKAYLRHLIHSGRGCWALNSLHCITCISICGWWPEARKIIAGEFYNWKNIMVNRLGQRL